MEVQQRRTSRAVVNRPAFFDTNVFIYADDASAPARQARAIQLITGYRRAGLLIVSIQVLQEYFAAVTRKLGVDPETAQQKVQLLTRARVVRFVEGDLIAAIELHRLNRISFWDAMIVHAARLAGAELLYTEDLQHGAVLGGVRIENPFLAV
ncbi:MAG: PIN domain-containing protein [Bryobacterales bacterium]|nr:PIN domain-containing protein [Bryobacterales bacterium]